MRLGIMQPYFFPYIGYWQLIKAVDKYIIYDDVNFIKGGWVNRNNILINRESKLINLRLHDASPNKLINEIEVLDDQIYKNKFLKSLESNYKKAPYFSETYPMISTIINQEEKNLGKFLEFSIEQVCNYLSITTEIIVSSSLNKRDGLRGQGKVIDICKGLYADEYINAIGGQTLYSYKDFKANGIELKFLKTGDIQYKQFENEFVPNLSIIDVMMFNEPSKIREMLDNYKLL